jgi:hypothetical protein
MPPKISKAKNTTATNATTIKTSAGYAGQRHKNSAARCRERLHSLLETLWNMVPEEDRGSRGHQQPGSDISRAEKIGAVVGYIRKLKAEANQQ